LGLIKQKGKPVELPLYNFFDRGYLRRILQSGLSPASALSAFAFAEFPVFWPVNVLPLYVKQLAVAGLAWWLPATGQNCLVAVRGLGRFGVGNLK
jgi:hypothetical protein